MIAPTVKIKKVFDDRRELKAILRTLETHYVKAGVLSGSGAHGTSDATVAEVAAYNEFGTENIPERSFLRPVFRDREGVVPTIKMAIPKFVLVLSGKRLRKKPNVKRFFDALGMYLVSAIQKNIRSNIQPENAESTKAKKGPAKTSTLIDTGAMLQAIAYKTERNK